MFQLNFQKLAIKFVDTLNITRIEQKQILHRKKKIKKQKQKQKNPTKMCDFQSS